MFLAYPILTGVQTREVIGGFYLLCESIMLNKFKRWDIVTTTNKDNRIDAVVDFQDGDKVYISEWWKNLNNPIRYIVPSNILYKKEGGKLVVSLKEINALMSTVLRIQDADYNNEPSIDNLKVWSVVWCDSSKYTYVWQLDWEPVRDRDGYFCTINKDDIAKLFWTRESVCKELFDCSPKDIKVI